MDMSHTPPAQLQQRNSWAMINALNSRTFWNNRHISPTWLIAPIAAVNSSTVLSAKHHTSRSVMNIRHSHGSHIKRKRKKNYSIQTCNHTCLNEHWISSCEMNSLTTAHLPHLCWHRDCSQRTSRPWIRGIKALVTSQRPVRDRMPNHSCLCRVKSACPNNPFNQRNE